MQLFASSTAILSGFWKEVFPNPGFNSKGCLWKTTVLNPSDPYMDHCMSDFHMICEEITLGI